ncbi:hypothetical protein GOP56_22245 [Brevibacillus sp. 7WMA2]|uniref:Uncharacterized protein n=1 Tax=Brevibacillus laterosporus LMG 15441 TaxID=1042163 RepID=A0A075R7Q9_BRELA|nr:MULTISPECIES: hypothetical protein [Brevibacillus]HAS02089.1 hypothetical protein [Brevibacillus sp.]AIG25615.1 hypothetical protein BRLA_c012750 [Brevibacillus laterosporus LMG 15441]AYK07155.1 hypothetical protein D8Z77_12660 [Brevibacillus laterosporus]MBA4531173.1 hypothetical protein [Brevibacillus halotolerans]MCR8994026.1 hypothetical protein [Brevibacillus laterosporus]
MSSMPRGSYKDQFHQRLYVQLNQGHNKLDYRKINSIENQMQHEVDDYAHMQHDLADELGMNKH